ncbi:MAG: polysaccharide deacetylase family protein [Gammaproteobacteria bacterium]|nr:polysaccharide deacetylase family protein [Gammaproteobacteria bacterium]
MPLEKDLPPQLIVVIDTEEEFDWNKPVDREATSVVAMQYIHRVQDIFDEYGINPCYVIDYPVASQQESYSHLVQIFKDKRCEIGAHLHPWVNPPVTEELTSRNTYPGNLGQSLEHEKLKNLTHIIQQNFGFQPNIYKAGRYGFGNNTALLLKQLGYQIDLSYCPSFDHSMDGGPDYSGAHAEPFWLDNDKKLLEIPVSGSFVGSAGASSKRLFHLAQGYKKFKLPGVLSKLGIVDRLVLTPEGYTHEEHVKITQFLYRKGVRTFTWSFHSPTVMPGTTPYVKNEQDVKKFLDSFHQYFDFFFNTMNGVATTPTRLKNKLESM